MTIWHLEAYLPDGHRLFAFGDLWAIADSSGRTPPDTDDGTLFLDQKRPLRIQRNDCDHEESMFIPLIDGREHKQTVTTTNARTILWLSKYFDWTIETGTRTETNYYNVRQ